MTTFTDADRAELVRQLRKMTQQHDERVAAAALSVHTHA